MITGGLQRCCYALDVYLSKEITLKKNTSQFSDYDFFMFIFSVSAWVSDILLTLTYSSDHQFILLLPT